MNYNKWIFVLLFITQASFASINPARVLNHLFFVNQEPNYEQGLLVTKGILVTPHKNNINRATISETRRMKVYVNEDFYQLVQNKAASVFEIHNQNANATTSYGSGFLIDKNIVLTNHHVVFSNNPHDGCKTTTLKIYAQEDNKSTSHSLQCKEVIYCDELNDFCLVDFYPLKYNRKTYQLSELFPRVHINTNYLTSANTNLLSRDNRLMDNSSELISINNSFGLGIQASSGRGFMVMKKHKDTIKECRQKKEKRRIRCLERQRKNSITQLHHYAPIFQGASGSPVFNREGSVVAITRAMTATEQYGPQAVNYATPINVIIDTLKADQQFHLVDLFQQN